MSRVRSGNQPRVRSEVRVMLRRAAYVATRARLSSQVQARSRAVHVGGKPNRLRLYAYGASGRTTVTRVCAVLSGREVRGYARACRGTVAVRYVARVSRVRQRSRRYGRGMGAPHNKRPCHRSWGRGSSVASQVGCRHGACPRAVTIRHVARSWESG